MLVPKILLIDNYDSFTYNLCDYLEQSGARCTVIRNDAPELPAILQEKWDGVVLSPGPKTPTEAGQLMQILSFFCGKIPILGVCLGHQAIGLHFGGILRKAPLPMHGKTSRITHNGDPLFAHIDSPTEVMRYHSLVITDIAHTPLQAIAQTCDNVAIMMALRHPTLPIYGVQYHPESVGTPHGLRLIANWLQTFA